MKKGSQIKAVHPKIKNYGLARGFFIVTAHPSEICLHRNAQSLADFLRKMDRAAQRIGEYVSSAETVFAEKTQTMGVLSTSV